MTERQSAENDACPRCGCTECICGNYWIGPLLTPNPYRSDDDPE